MISPPSLACLNSISTLNKYSSIAACTFDFGLNLYSGAPELTSSRPLLNYRNQRSVIFATTFGRSLDYVLFVYLDIQVYYYIQELNGNAFAP